MTAIQQKNNGAGLVRNLCMTISHSQISQRAFSLAGLSVNVSGENLAKPDTHERNTLSYMRDFPVCTALNFETSTRGEGWNLKCHHQAKNTDAAVRVARKNYAEFWLKHLLFSGVSGYFYNAPAKSGVGIGLPVISMATYDAPSVFFCVVSSEHPFFSDAGIIRAAHKVMVGCVGASSEAPVSIEAGKTNSAQPTTSKIGLFGGGLHHSMEAAAMLATTPTQKPQFIWLIAAVRRDCPTISAVIHHIPADSEQNARRALVRDHVCFFAGRLPVAEVRNA